jgi:hypothetical protein
MYWPLGFSRSAYKRACLLATPHPRSATFSSTVSCAAASTAFYCYGPPPPDLTVACLPSWAGLGGSPRLRLARRSRTEAIVWHAHHRGSNPLWWADAWRASAIFSLFRHTPHAQHRPHVSVCYRPSWLARRVRLGSVKLTMRILSAIVRWWATTGHAMRGPCVHSHHATPCQSTP